MDHPFRLAASALLAGGLALACSPPAATPEGTSAPAPGAAKTSAATSDATVVAEIGGEAVTAGDLDAFIREDLFRQEVTAKGKAEQFEIRSGALERMLDERLVAAEAAKQSITPEQLLAKEARATKPVSEDDVKAFFEQNKGRMGASTLEQLSPRIRRFLEEQQSGEAREAYTRSLRDKAGVTIKLDAPRIQVAADGPSKGPADAPITIVEFSDYQCPFCRRAEPIVDEVMKRHPEQVRVVFRHFPLDQIHPRARPAAEAAACAEEQGKFWEFHEKLFGGGGFEESDLTAYAAAVGLDADKFKACVTERRFQAKVEADVAAGREAGVSGTPAFFVNGIMFSGAKPVEEFSAIIERELKGKKAGS